MFSKDILVDAQERSLVIVTGSEEDFGIEMMAGTSGNYERGVITISFLRFKHAQQQVRAVLNDEEFWQLVAKKFICGAEAPLQPSTFERLLIEDHQHDEIFDDVEDTSN